MNEIATDYEGRLVERVVDHGAGARTRITYDPETGLPTDVEDLKDLAPALPDPSSGVLEAVQNAREAVAGFSQNSGTRQAIEKLADAVTTLIT